MRSSLKRSAICSVEGLELDDGEVGIDAGEGALGELFHVVHGAAGLDYDGAGVEANVFGRSALSSWPGAG